MLILEGVKTLTLASKELHRAFKNLSEQFELIWQAFVRGEQNYEVEIKKNANFFVNSSLEAIVHLVPKTSFTWKIKQKITPISLQNFVPTC